MNTTIYPPALKKGDTIGVLAPSSHYDAPLIEQAIQIFESQGFKIAFHPQIHERHGQFAGTPAQKIAAVHDYFKDPNIKAILPIAGGNGVIHLLDGLDYDLIRRNPKIIMGFSDATILLNAITAKTGLVTFHGPSFARMAKITPEWQKQTFDVLLGKETFITLNTDVCTSGVLYGGCLSPFQALIGTPYAPNLDKAILLLEDVNDHLSRYDRMIAHMKQAGWLKKLSAIILGEFIDSQDNADRPFGFTIEEIIHANAPDIPLITSAPFGHGVNLCTLPIGANCALKNGQLSFKPLS